MLTKEVFIYLKNTVKNRHIVYSMLVFHSCDAKLNFQHHTILQKSF